MPTNLSDRLRRSPSKGATGGLPLGPLAGPWRQTIGPIALEFRDGFARALQVDQTTGAVIAAARVAHDEAHPARTAELIASAAAGEGFRGNACVVGLPLGLVRAEVMCVDDGHDDSIRRAVEQEAVRRFRCASPQAGFIRLAPAEHGRVQVVAIVADRTAIERILNPLLDWGLVPEAAEPAFLSVARACSRVFRRAKDRSRVRVAIDTSRSGATAMLLAGDRIAYVKSTHDVACIADTAAACLRYGLPFVADAQAPSEIRLTGALAEVSSLTASLESACGLPVRLDDDRSTIGMMWRSISGRVAGEDRPWEWSVALGLSFRGAARRSLRSLSAHYREEAA